MASENGSESCWRWLAGLQAQLQAVCDGLTEAILLVAEIAATRRPDWRMALENIAAVLKRLLRWHCNQLRLMQEWQRGDGDGVEDGELCREGESPAGSGGKRSPWRQP